MKLYYAPGACSLAPHIVLRELGLPHTAVQVNLKEGRAEDGSDYRLINPKGYVPALVLDSGERLTEVAMLLQFLADRVPGAGLAPANGTMERYRLQEWLNFISAEIHKAYAPLWTATTPEEEKQRARARLAGRFDWLNPQLGANTHLMGERFTVADAYLFIVLNWAQCTGIDLARWPALTRYTARIAARPAVRAAMKAEGLVK
jgi:glutathione S-transferase